MMSKLLFRAQFVTVKAAGAVVETVMNAVV
jgi:hypothetical protein